MHAAPDSQKAPSSEPPPDQQVRVLLVDDDPAVLRVAERWLVKQGHAVTTATDGRQAVDLLAVQSFDVIVSDIQMPGMSGIQLLRTVRERDMDVPVILLTGAPDLETATAAVEHGAIKYLAKPLNLPVLAGAVTQAARLHRMAHAKREALELLAAGGQGIAERAALGASFERTLAGLWVAVQPIIRASDRALFGYEALMRSTVRELPHPGAILDAAERLNRLHDLGRTVRDASALIMKDLPDRGTLFVNLHSHDLLDDSLYSPESPLSAMASRVILEITERTALDDVRDLPARAAALRRMGFRLAIDDLGAGYAGLTSFATIEPEVVKLDMSLVRDIDKNATKRKLVRRMTELSHEMGILVVAEGIESSEERDEIVSSNVDLLQGYRFAKPCPPFPEIAW